MSIVESSSARLLVLKQDHDRSRVPFVMPLSLRHEASRGNRKKESPLIVQAGRWIAICRTKLPALTTFPTYTPATSRLSSRGCQATHWIGHEPQVVEESLRLIAAR